MTISSMKNSPISYIYMFCCFAFFWGIKLIILGGSMKAEFTLKSFALTIILSLFIGIVYILQDICKISYIERNIIKKSSYYAYYDCGIYENKNVPFIVQIKKDCVDIYMHESYFFLSNYYLDKKSFISKLKNRCDILNATDYMYIYMYKYTGTLIFTCTFFLLWHACLYVTIVNSVILGVIISISLTLSLLCICSFIDECLEEYITNIMKKRNLEYFITK